MRETLPSDSPRESETPAEPFDGRVLDGPERERPRDQPDDIESPIGAGRTPPDDRPDVLPDVEPPDEQA